MLGFLFDGFAGMLPTKVVAVLLGILALLVGLLLLWAYYG
jgi:hypothetical protein